MLYTLKQNRSKPLQTFDQSILSSLFRHYYTQLWYRWLSLDFLNLPASRSSQYRLPGNHLYSIQIKPESQVSRGVLLSRSLTTRMKLLQHFTAPIPNSIIDMLSNVMYSSWAISLLIKPAHRSCNNYDDRPHHILFLTFHWDDAKPLQFSHMLMLGLHHQWPFQWRQQMLYRYSCS